MRLVLRRTWENRAARRLRGEDSIASLLRIDATATAGDDPSAWPTFAHGIARSLATLRRSSSTLVAVRGPWGSGKTSIVDLVLAELRDASEPYVVRFNPWLDSDRHPVEALSARMREVSLELASPARALVRHGAPSSAARGLPVIQAADSPRRWPWAWIDPRRTTRTIARFRSWRHVRRAFRKLERPVVIAVDDVDRTLPEHRDDVFRLLRLIASLASTVGIVAVDPNTLPPSPVVRGPLAGWRRTVPAIAAYDLPRTVRRRPPTAEE